MNVCKGMKIFVLSPLRLNEYNIVCPCLRSYGRLPLSLLSPVQFSCKENNMETSSLNIAHDWSPHRKGSKCAAEPCQADLDAFLSPMWDHPERQALRTSLRNAKWFRCHFVFFFSAVVKETIPV